MKKCIAPVIIGVIMIIYFSTVGLSVLFSSTFNFFQKILITFIPLCFAGLSVYVMFKRINEIKGGEEDDASKY